MGLNSRWTGDYTITSITNGNFNANVSAVNIYGNLNVFGKTTQFSIANSSITNNFITLNDGYVGLPLLNSGIIVNRGDIVANVVLQYSENFSRWQITNDGALYGNILTDLGGGGGLPLVDTNVYIATSNIAFPALDRKVALYGRQPVQAGASGLFVTSTQFSDQELIIKTKALIYTVLL
jgi:hypothetical protein